MGRISLFLLVLGVLGLGWGGRVAWRAWQTREIPDLPTVSAAPPLVGMAATWIKDPPRSRQRFALAREEAEQIDPSAVPRLVEWLDPVGPASFRWRDGLTPTVSTVSTVSDDGGPLRVEYSLDEKLTGNVFDILRRGRVERGIVIVLDPRSGRLLTYVSTDPVALPPERAYPAASIVKIITAATLLQEAPAEAESPCVYRGNKYRLHSRRLARPASGR